MTWQKRDGQQSPYPFVYQMKQDEARVFIGKNTATGEVFRYTDLDADRAGYPEAIINVERILTVIAPM